MAETYTPNYNWTKPSLGGDANTWGSVLNGTIDKIDNQVFLLNGQLGATTLSIARGADGGAYGQITFTNVAIAPALVGTQPRWILYEDSTTESSGGNAGTNFGLNAYNDSGAFLGTAFSIVRATLATTFGGAMTINGALTTNGALTVSGPTLINNNLIVNGTLTPGAIAGNPSFSGSINVGGTLTVGSSVNTNGLSATNATLANLLVTNAASFETYYAGTQFQLGASGSARWLQFSSSWSLNWNTSGGLLYWNTPGGPGGTEWAPFQVDAAGNVSYAGSLIHISDAGAKENIIPFDGDPLAAVTKIPVKLYNLLKKPERHLGFIAQDVQAIMPEAVMPTKDGVLGVAQEPLVAMLWSAVQKLTERVQELESRLAP